MKPFKSIYANLIDEYLQFKRSLGYKMSHPTNFSLFDSFVIDHQLSTIGLSKEECDLWSKKRPNEKNTTCYSRTNDIRNFCFYMIQNSYKTCIPKYTVKSITDYIPYIFTKEELHRFFKACDSLEITAFSNTTCIYPALFRLLLGTGIRINEALNLRMSDLNFINETLILYETKNGEERVIPFSKSLSAILQLYIHKHRLLSDTTDYVFVKKDNSKLSNKTAYEWFRKILGLANIPHGGRKIGPSVHCFRHTFSVHSLAKMDELGLDLYYALPILSKYLGHKTLEATDKYVRMTEEMYPGIMSKMNQLCSYVFPEVMSHETY